MAFWERMKEVVEKGVETSKDILGKAADEAKKLGEKGVLKFEIMQLEKNAEKKLALLGTQVFEALVKQEKASISKGTSGIKELIEELEELEVRIDEKEEELKKI
ncbi:MAG: hypothetical protein JW904_14610 [Spirochaetales bacterium]|nr:hypothetical protein [Spirochaetales bacterium]